jgi:hypothetical protein
MPATVRAARRPAARRVARTLHPPSRRVAVAGAPLEGTCFPPPAAPGGGLPDALRHELAVILADMAWARYRKEDADDLVHGEP